jgi:hypothetical protein
VGWIIAGLILRVFLLLDRVRQSLINAVSIPFIRAAWVPVNIRSLERKLIRERKERNVRWKKFHFYEINYEKMTKNVTIRLPEDNFSDGWLLEPMSVGPLS